MLFKSSVIDSFLSLISVFWDNKWSKMPFPSPWYISWTANREALFSTAPYMRRLQFQNPILKDSMPGTVAAVKEKLGWSLADNSLQTVKSRGICLLYFLDTHGGLMGKNSCKYTLESIQLLEVTRPKVLFIICLLSLYLYQLSNGADFQKRVKISLYIITGQLLCLYYQMYL